MIKNVIEYFSETLKLQSNKIAVIEGEKKITFSDLEFKSKILAEGINKAVGTLNKPIAIFLPKTIESVISNLAVTFSGNIYMNLDIKTPIERINNII